MSLQGSRFYYFSLKSLLLLLFTGVARAYLSQFWHFSTPENPGPSLSLSTGAAIQNGSLLLQSNSTGHYAANITQPITFGDGVTFIIRMKLMSIPFSRAQYAFLPFIKTVDTDTSFIMVMFNNSLHIGVPDDNSTEIFPVTATLPLNKWFTVTLVCPVGGPWSAYQDGQQSSLLTPNAPALKSGPRVGSFMTGMFDGLIDLFWIRSRSLGKVEVMLSQVDIDLWATSWSFQSETAMPVSSPDLVLIGNPDLTGGVLNLDPTDPSRYVNVTNPVPNIPGNDSFSIYIRFKSSLNQSIMPLVEFSTSAAPPAANIFFISLCYNPGLNFCWGTTTPSFVETYIPVASTVQRDQWTDLVLVVSNNTKNTYQFSVNGGAPESPNTAPITPPSRLVDHPAQFIGRVVDYSVGLMDGSIERITMFPRALDMTTDVKYLSLPQEFKIPLYLWDFSAQSASRYGNGIIDLAQAIVYDNLLRDELSGALLLSSIEVITVVTIRMRLDLYANGTNIFQFIDTTPSSLSIQLWLMDDLANSTKFFCFLSGASNTSAATCCDYSIGNDPWFTIIISIPIPNTTAPSLTGRGISLTNCGPPPNTTLLVLGQHQIPRTRFGGAFDPTSPPTNATFSIDYITLHNASFASLNGSQFNVMLAASNALDSLRVHCLQFILPANLSAQGVTVGTCLYGGLGTQCELGCRGDQQPLQPVTGTCTANDITSERAKWVIPNLATMKCIGVWSEWLGSSAPNLPANSDPRTGIPPDGSISFYPRISPMKICPPSTYVQSIVAGATDFLRQVYMSCSDGTTVLQTAWDSSSTSFSTWRDMVANPTMGDLSARVSVTSTEVGPISQGWTPAQVDAVYYGNNQSAYPYIVGFFSIPRTFTVNTTHFVSNISDTADDHTVLLRGFQTEEFPDVNTHNITSISRLRFFFSEINTTITRAPTPSPITSSPTTSSPTTSSPTTSSPTTSPTHSPTTSSPITNTPTTNTPTIAPTPLPITMAPTVPGTTIVVTVGNGNGNGNSNGVSSPSPPPGQAVLQLTVEVNNNNNETNSNISTEEVGRQIANQVLQALYLQYTLNNLTLTYPPHVTVLIPNTTTSSSSSSSRQFIVIVEVDESVARTLTSSSSSSSSSLSSSLVNINGYKISGLSIRWPSVVNLLKSLSIGALVVVIVIFVLVVLMVIGGHMKARDMKGLLTFTSVITTLFSFALSLWFFAILYEASQSNNIIITSSTSSVSNSDSNNNNNNNNNFSTITTQDGSSYKPYFIAFTLFLFLSPTLNGCVLLIRWRYLLAHDGNLQAWMVNHPLLKIIAIFLSLFSLSNLVIISSSLLGRVAAPISSQTRLAVSAFGVWGGLMELPKLVIQFLLIANHSDENAAASAWLPLSMSALSFFVGVLQRCYALGYLRGNATDIRGDLELKGVR